MEARGRAASEATAHAEHRGGGGHADGEWRDGFARPQVFLQPIAAPSILGFFGLATATMMVGANLAGWYGSLVSPLYLFPFAGTFGGLTQLLACMWAFRARDPVATAMHGTWGSYWIGYSILQGLVLAGKLPFVPKGAVSHDLAFWFIMLAAVTFSGAAAALVENPGLVTIFGPLASGAACLAVGYWVGSSGWITAGGWLLAFAAGFAWYNATALMLLASSGRTILPLGKPKRSALRPGGKEMESIQLPWAEPGIRQGQ